MRRITYNAIKKKKEINKFDFENLPYRLNLSLTSRKKLAPYDVTPFIYNKSVKRFCCPFVGYSNFLFTDNSDILYKFVLIRK